MPYTSYSDSYLMHMNKLELIELLRCAEHNYFAMEEALNNATNAGKEITEKYDEAKRLLESATNVLKRYKSCDGDYDCSECIHQRRNCEYDDRFKWRYADEALKLIGDSENG